METSNVVTKLETSARMFFHETVKARNSLKSLLRQECFWPMAEIILEYATMSVMDPVWLRSVAARLPSPERVNGDVYDDNNYFTSEWRSSLSQMDGSVIPIQSNYHAGMAIRFVRPDIWLFCDYKMFWDAMFNDDAAMLEAFRRTVVTKYATPVAGAHVNDHIYNVYLPRYYLRLLELRTMILAGYSSGRPS